MTLYFLIVCLMLLYFFKYFYTNRKVLILSWKLDGPFALPILGNALAFFCKNEEILQRAVQIAARYSSPVRFWLGSKFLLAFTDPNQIQILSSTVFSQKDPIYKFLKIPNGEGLISASGLKWKRDRKLMAPLFHKKNVEKFFPIIATHSDGLLQKLEKQVEGSSFDAGRLLHRCCADFVNESIIGIKTNAQNGELDDFLEAVDRMYELVHARITKFWLQIECLFRFTKLYKQQEADKTKIHNFLRQTEKQLTEETLLAQILQIQEANPTFARGEDLVHHLCTLYTASEDTVTTIAAFSLLLFGMHPEIQNKVYREICKILDQRELELNDLSKFAYLEMCFKEVLRLFPIAPFLMRSAERDFQLDHILIPKDCSVVVCIHNVHRDPKFWKKPNSFYPEHFLPADLADMQAFAYLPFSAGPRSCLGRSYSYMALKILLIKILQKFEISSDEKFENLELKTDISVRPKSGLYPIKIKLRK